MKKQENLKKSEVSNDLTQSFDLGTSQQSQDVPFPENLASSDEEVKVEDPAGDQTHTSN